MCSRIENYLTSTPAGDRVCVDKLTGNHRIPFRSKAILTHDGRNNF